MCGYEPSAQVFKTMDGGSITLMPEDGTMRVRVKEAGGRVAEVVLFAGQCGGVAFEMDAVFQGCCDGGDE